MMLCNICVCHAIGSHSVLALHLYLAACNTSSSCRFWVLDHLCSNLSKSFHPISLPCAFCLSAPQPSRRHHAQSLLGPSFFDSRTHHVLESHPEQAAPLSRRDDERWHAISSNSVHALLLHLAACSPSSSCRFWFLDHLYSKLSQSFHLCWITEIRSLNLCVCFIFSSSTFAFLIEMNFSSKSLFAIWSLSPQRFHYYFFLSIVSWQYQKYSTILILS